MENAADSRPEPEKEEIAHALKLHARIKDFEGRQKKRRKSWAKARTYVNGNPGSDGEGGLVRVNLIGSFVETLQANIYAKAPEIAVTPEERSDEKEYPAVTATAKTLQAALNTFLVKDAKMKQRGKAAVRATLTSNIAWVKVLYQRDKAAEPLAKNNLSDIQDNIANLERLKLETQDESTCANYDAKIIELRQQQLALDSEKIEVQAAEGLVIDNVPSEDVIVMDGSIRDIDEMPGASAVCHKIKMTGAAFKAAFKVKPPNTAAFEVQTSDDEDGEKQDVNSEVDEDDRIVVVYEVWSKDDNTVYTLCKGHNRYIRPPYQPDTLGERWYPFFPLQIRRVDGVLYPLSIVELLLELQDEYNTRHTRAAAHRSKNIPVRLINKASGITDEEIRKINGRSLGNDVIAVSGDPSQPLQNQIVAYPEIPFNPQMYDASDVMRDMEMVAGVQDASRGAINKAKTATEAEIMSQGMQSRSSEVIDTVEEWLTAIAEYAAHLLILNMSKESVQKRLGQSAIWPEIAGRELLAMMGVTIRGGSTARPNKMRERDQWIQLMPMIQEALQKSVELKAAGDAQTAKAVMKVLQETLNRFDEKLDISEFLGVDLDAEEEQPQFEMPPELQQKIQQGEMLIQDLQAKLQEASEALKSKVDDQQIARVNADRQAQATLDAAQIKADADVAAKTETAKMNAQVERERIASAERVAMGKEYIAAGIPGMQMQSASCELCIDGVCTCEKVEQPKLIGPNDIVQALAGQAEAQIQSTQAIAEMIAQGNAQNAQAVTQMAALVAQAMTAPKTATLSNGRTITVRTGA